MRRFAYLGLCVYLAACSVHPVSTKPNCQAGYACLTISLKTPLTEYSFAPPAKAEVSVARVEQILSLAAQETESVQGFTLYKQGLLNLFDADRLWSYSQGEGITVAVIDSGVDTEHESLRSRVLPGYDFIENHPYIKDPLGHGTAVAAIIAGNGNIKGIAPKAKIYPCESWIFTIKAQPMM
jgi:subtilisin family serine protease